MVVGLIPARSGSERIADKNVRRLAGHPLMAYSIVSALESELFDKVIVSSDSPPYLEIAKKYGAETHERPERFATGGSPDFEWIDWVLNKNWHYSMRRPEYFAILRPTSPFRSADTIRRCFDNWDRAKYDSIRAVEPVSQHPGKMWIVRSDTMYPLLPMGPADPPWHSSQMKTLPAVYVQNASLEMATLEVFNRTRTISGWRIQAFMTNPVEGFDINTEYDFEIAERMVDDGTAALPRVYETH